MRREDEEAKLEDRLCGSGVARLVGGIGFGYGKFFARNGFEFAADDVGRESCGEEAAVEGGELFVRDFAPEGAEFAFDALADEGGFVMGLGGFGDGGVDMAIGNAAGAEVSCDAVFALLADFGAAAGELFGVAGVV